MNGTSDMAQHSGVPVGSRRDQWYTGIALACIVLLGLFLRIYRLSEYAVWADEYVTIAQVGAPDVASCLREQRVKDVYMVPVYHVMQYYWARLVSDSVVGIRWLSILFGMLAIPLLYVFGRALYGRWSGLLAALCLALSPFQIFHAQGIRYYSLMALLGLISAYAFFKVVQQGGVKWWAINIGANALLMWTHLLGVLLLVPEGCFLVLCRFRKARSIVLWAGIHVLLLAPVVAWVLTVEAGSNVTDYTVSVRDLGRHLFYGDTTYLGWTVGSIPGRFGESNLSDGIRFIVSARVKPEKALAWALFLCIPVLGLWTLWSVWREGARSAGRAEAAADQPLFSFGKFAFLVLWFLLPSLVLFACAKLLHFHWFWPRYTIFSMPALYLIAGGAAGGVGWRPLRVVLSCVLVCLFGIQTVAALALPRRDDYYGAVRHIKAHASSDDTIVAYPGKELFEYNMGPTDMPMLGPTHRAELFAKVDAIVGDGGGAWVVCFDDGDPLISSVCDQYFSLRGIQYAKEQFLGVNDVYIYHCVAGPAYRDPQSPESIAALRGGVQRFPENVWLGLRAAELLAEVGDYEGAWQEVERARQAGVELPPVFLEELKRDSHRNE